MLCFWVAFVTLLPIIAFGSGNPLPYVKTANWRSAESTFSEIQKLPVGSVARTEFFAESKKNTGMSEARLSMLVATAGIETRRCGDCQLETAGLISGKSVYWRRVKHSERVTYVRGPNGELIPWFLPRCGNPVRPPAKKVVEKPPEIYYPPCGCRQTGPPVVMHPYNTDNGGFYIGGPVYSNDYLGGWTYFIPTGTGFSGTTIYTPVECWSDKTFKKEDSK